MLCLSSLNLVSSQSSTRSVGGDGAWALPDKDHAAETHPPLSPPALDPYGGRGETLV
ncbi:hypothetical protein IG631_03924 [Alternaria alternata]|nr:hypothetical protein IG631_03924 [Alternaria alternata]